MEDPRAASDPSGRSGHHLLQAGALLFLLGLLTGLAVPFFAIPRLGLSTHLLGLMQGTYLLAMGLLWPRLRLTASQARISSRLAIGGALSAWTANLYGAIWGAGGSMVPIATGGARGTALQERLIGALLVAAALCLVGSALLTVWGLRGGPRQDA